MTGVVILFIIIRRRFIRSYVAIYVHSGSYVHRFIGLITFIIVCVHIRLIHSRFIGS